MKNNIRSILERKIDSVKGYSDAFLELATIYSRIPPNKIIAMVRYLGLENKFDEKLNKIDLEILSEKVHKMCEDKVVLEAVCKHYSCAFKMRYFVEQFLNNRFSGENDLSKVGVLIREIACLRAIRWKYLHAFCDELADLDTEDNASAENKFKEKWNTLWENMLRPDDEKAAFTIKTKAQEPEVLSKAIERVWNAENADAAVKCWKENDAIWRSQNVMSGTRREAIIKNMAMPSISNILNLKLKSIPTPDEINFALTLLISESGNVKKYKQCAWILTYSTDSFIKNLKEKFKNDVPDLTDNISVNSRFCEQLVYLWQSSYRLGLKGLLSYCEPDAGDFQKYVSLLGPDIINSVEVKNVAQIVRDYYFP